jgi:tetratricopeptide (TPR) repeat protein
MPSKKLSQMLNPIEPKQENVLSLGENRRAFSQLVAFVQVAEGFTLGFIESNFAKDTDVILTTLQEHPACQDVRWEILTFNDPSLRFLRDGLVEALQQVTIQNDKRLIVVVRGLEYSIGLSGNYPPMLQDLNFVRDDLPKSVPYPLIFCLPDYAITRLARFAPDLWAWKSGLFRFQSSKQTRLEVVAQILEDDSIRGSWELQERQERIDLLQRLLMEFQPSGHTPTSGDRKRCADILLELGVLYRNVGEVLKSENSLKDGLALVEDDDLKLSSIKASLYLELGLLYKKLGRIDEALALYGQSLALTSHIGDEQGKAITLHNMAVIHDNQGQIDEATALYKQSLEIKERIKDEQGKAATLHQIAGTYVKQGQIDEAITLYNKSLVIKEQIGNLQGQAATLHAMADVYMQQSQIDKAMVLYNRSLELEERIGNLQGQAETLHQIAHVYDKQGQVEEAIALYQKSLEIAERIGDIHGKAPTLAMLGQIAEAKEDYDTAILYLQEALEIFQQLKSPKIEAIQSILDRITRERMDRAHENSPSS